MKYFKIKVKYAEVHEVIVSAENVEEAKEKAMQSWGNDRPIEDGAYVDDIVELEEKRT